MSTTAPILTLPLEIREQIYTHLTSSTPLLHHRDPTRTLHLSAPSTPPLALLQTHPLFHHELLEHFHRHAHLTLHIDAWAFARLHDPSRFASALQNCSYLANTHSLDLRPTLNASISFLVSAMEMAIPILNTHCTRLRTVTVTWAETEKMLLHHVWRPWPYKAPALRPIVGLRGDLQVRCGEVVNAPVRTRDAEQEGFVERMGRVLGERRARRDG